MHILHGDNTAISRKKLFSLLESKNDSTQKILRLSGNEVTPELLEQSVSSTTLFGEKTVLVLEKLLSLPASKKLTSIVEVLGRVAESADIIIWEPKTLTASQLKKIPSTAVVEKFVFPSTVFAWLDAVGTGDKKTQVDRLTQAIAHSSAESVFFLLVRHVRNLLLSLGGGEIAGPPFAKQKILSQAQKIGEAKLVGWYHFLCEVDKDKLSKKLSTGEWLMWWVYQDYNLPVATTPSK